MRRVMSSSERSNKKRFGCKSFHNLCPFTQSLAKIGYRDDKAENVLRADTAAITQNVIYLRHQKIGAG